MASVASPLDILGAIRSALEMLCIIITKERKDKSHRCIRHAQNKKLARDWYMFIEYLKVNERQKHSLEKLIVTSKKNHVCSIGI